jgi:hypothetical protein
MEKKLANKNRLNDRNYLLTGSVVAKIDFLRSVCSVCELSNLHS